MYNIITRPQTLQSTNNIISTDMTNPLFSPNLAIAFSLLYTTLYIAPFYLSPTLRHTPLNSRNAPACIRARIHAVAWTCLVCTILTTTLLLWTGTTTITHPLTLLRLLGLYPISIPDILRVLLLTATLFSCSLYELLIIDRAYTHLSLSTLKQTLWTDPRGFRNLLIAPASEELVFRSLTLPLYLLAGVSPAICVWTTPLVFGLAHAHHLVEFLQSSTPPTHVWWAPPSRVLVVGLVRTVFQFAYTSLFGFFAVFVWLRTGSWWGCVVVHGVCNFMGVPRLWGKVGDEVVEEDEEGEGKGWSKGRRSVAWTVVYYALVPLGMYGFYRLLWVLTESENALVQL